MFNVESPAELHAINQVAAEVGRKARIALRINPDIDPKTHPYISTGLKKSKFGIAAERAVEDFVLAASMSHIEVVGVHAHIGSQLTDVTPFTEALKKVVSLIETLKGRGLNISYLNIGGGLGITYSDEKPPLPQDLSNAILPLMQDLKVTLVMEPGRVIVGNAGILVTKAMYLKEGETKSFVIVDAAMNDLIRPSLYDAYHEVRPVNEEAGRRAKQTVDIVGPVCESGDFLAKDRSLPVVKPGELLAVMSAGAYGFVMASNYNSRPRVPEVLVRNGEFHVIRERERYEDLVKGEQIPSLLNTSE
jgi:diaminopimelate decarboxylase